MNRYMILGTGLVLGTGLALGTGLFLGAGLALKTCIVCTSSRVLDFRDFGGSRPVVYFEQRVVRRG